MIPRLSKTQFVRGCQCPLALWLDVNRRDLKPPTDIVQQELFDMGSEVGRLAQQYFPGGRQISAKYWEVEKAAKETEALIKEGHGTIYEATVLHPRTGDFARIDILRRNAETSQWELIEVKSSTQVKDVHILDVGFQYYVLLNAGIDVDKCCLLLINNEYVRKGELDVSQLFKLEDVTEEVLRRYPEIETRAKELGGVPALPIEPVVEIGPHCDDPYECDFKSHCWKGIPELSVLNVVRGSKGFEVAREIGSFDVSALPEEHHPGGAKAIDLACHLENRMHIDREGLKSFLEELVYPLYFLDYETTNPGIPLVEGSRPYQQMPFQFSLHIQEEPDAPLSHTSFLHKEPSDPRPALADRLVRLCGDTSGSVVVYNRTFEGGCNKAIAKALPRYAGAFESINARMFDLLIPFRSRLIYHPTQNGSASIKQVLPAFSDLSYEGLKIGEGGTASALYQRFLRGLLKPQEIEQLWKNLEAYCRLDTLAMVEILAALRMLVNNKRGHV